VIVFVVLSSCLAATPVEAQDRPRPTLEAKRFARAPILDGDVLGEAMWMELDPATGFWQEEPFEGEPASERTEVRIGFTDRTLFIGVILYDSDAESLVTSDSRRDASLRNEDSFRVIFDTFNDKQNGFVFGTNLAGIQYDGQMSNEGRSGGRGRGGPGSGGGLNLDWNTSWQVRSLVGDFGWSAELAIPFRSLRYAAGGGTWGVNFERGIRRKNETAFWAQLPSQYNLFRVSEAGTLTGLETPKQRSLQVVPYVLGQGRDDGLNSTDADYDGGVDIKVGVTNGLTLDLTVNTDFAQVEVDEQQINLDRFSLFFPEKRPFFLENAALFSVGRPGSVDLFFSRRIGLTDSSLVPILGGVRLSGRAAGMNLGLLNMQTEGVRARNEDESDIAANNFTVVRMFREYRNRGRGGLIVVNRQGTGSLSLDDDYNRTFGIDGQIGIGRYTDLSGWAAKTSTPGLGGRDRAFSLQSSYGSPAWRWRAGYTEVGEDFNPEVGFLARKDYRELGGFVQRRFRPAKGRIQEWGPRIFWDDYWDLDGFHETGRYSAGGEISFRGGSRISLSAGANLEGLQEAFTLLDGTTVQPGSYRGTGFFMFLNTSRAKPVSIFARIRSSAFFGGRQNSIAPSISVRLGEYLTSEIRFDHNDVDLPGGSFKTNLGRLRVTYAFSTRVLLQTLIQYNDVTDDVSTNLRFSWLGQANTGLFVVYNEVREFGMLALPKPDRSLVIKYNRVFDVFR